MIVKFEEKEEKRKLAFNGSVAQLTKKLNLPINTVLVARKGVLLTDDDNLNDSDEIMIMSVVSGG